METQLESINWIIESQDGMAFINKAALFPDQKTIASLNPDFKSLVDSVLYRKESRLTGI